MAEVLSTLSAVITIAQQLRDFAKKSQDAEVANLVADLNMQLADLKMEMAQLKEENLSLHTELRSVKEAADLRSRLEFRENVYFFTEPVPGRSLGPFCPVCLDAENLLIPVAQLPDVFADVAKYKCNKCKGTY